LRSLKGPNDGRVPDIHHFCVARIVGMNTVAVVGRAAESRVLVNDPDGRLGLVLGLRPWRNGCVEGLDPGVGSRKVGAERDDLGDLVVLFVRNFSSTINRPELGCIPQS